MVVGAGGAVVVGGAVVGGGSGAVVGGAVVIDGNVVGGASVVATVGAGVVDVSAASSSPEQAAARPNTTITASTRCIRRTLVVFTDRWTTPRME